MSALLPTYFHTQNCDNDCVSLTATRDSTSSTKLPSVKVGGGSRVVKTEITPTMTVPPKPYQTTTHHCSQSIFCYDTGNTFDNKQRVDGWIPSPCIRTRVWVGLSGWVHFVSISPQTNESHLFKAGFQNWWKTSLCFDRHYECRPFSAPPASSRNQNTSKKVKYKLAFASLNKIWLSGVHSPKCV